MTTERRESILVFRIQRPVLITGAIALVLLIAAGFLTRDGVAQLLRSYLVGLIFVTTIPVGALGVLSIQYLTGGMWGVMIRKSLEAAARTLPFVSLAFVPILLGLHDLYVWTHDSEVAHDEILQQKVHYLNEPFFVARTVFFFLVWNVIAYLMNRWAREYEDSASPWTGLKLRNLSAGSLLILSLTLTFAAVDWMMSLEPHWYSTMYGISFIVGSLLAALAFVTLIATLLSEYAPLAELFRSRTYRDLGNLMLALVMLWAYTAFSQYMLIWYGNLREEAPYYLPRIQGFWGFLALLLIVFHFFLPFGLLLMRQIKDRPRTLGIVAALILVMRVIDHYWIIAPAFRPHGEDEITTAAPHWMDPLAVIAVAALWSGLFLWQLERRPLIPRNDPELAELEAVTHG